MRNLNEAKNMALRAEMMLQEKVTRFDDSNRKYGVEGSSTNRTMTEKSRDHEEKQIVSREKKDDNTTGKRPVEVKDNQRQNNPYAKPMLGRCY